MDEPPDIKLWVAYIAAAASLLTVLINVLLTRSSERKRREHEGRMAAQKEQHDKTIEKLRSELGGQLKQFEAQLEDQKAERNARRDYEYEARKRVYHEVEPILFQLAELAEGGLHRIYSLARTARNGNLSDPATSWLGSADQGYYYYHSTAYHLFAPLAAVKLLQRRITFVDLSVEKSIAAEYALAKALLITFTDDYDFARCRPVLEYDPNSDQLDTAAGKALFASSPEKYWRQGIFVGWVENLAEAMLTDETENRPARVRTFGEYERERDTKDSRLQQALRNVRYLFLRFHPAQRPVLWRLLVAQACIYHSFVEIRERKLTRQPAPDRPLVLLPESERKRLEWRTSLEQAATSDNMVFREPFETAREYFATHAHGILQTDDTHGEVISTPNSQRS